ncbi:hypothetical protein AB0M43_37820 [Longispora sp. NPDC051575]|uniref:hypothetical protein n=1 Tax=Longispora sp. NPDC051575 TaxID=3154943 RepID=UPI003448124B
MQLPPPLTTDELELRCHAYRFDGNTVHRDDPRYDRSLHLLVTRVDGDRWFVIEPSGAVYNHNTESYDRRPARDRLAHHATDLTTAERTARALLAEMVAERDAWGLTPL